MLTTPAFMILPSMACQASCKYCFGPHRGAVMDDNTARDTVRLIRNIGRETAATRINILFHGGEPLLAPIAVWRTLLGEIRTQLSGFKVNMSLQSNLWNLDQTMAELLAVNGVAVGTSLDGPEVLCDENRGEGYFARTNEGIRQARAAGLAVNVIATITRQTLPHVRQIVQYLSGRGFSIVLHTALASLDNANATFALTPEEYAGLITGLFPWYVQNSKHVKIETLDHYCKGLVRGNPIVCSFHDCQGLFLVLSPTGDITPCQRLAGNPAYVMGNVRDNPTLAQLYESSAALAMKERQRRVTKRCGDCEFLSVCRGGCYYNALASGDGTVDPLCEAYRAIYRFVQQRITEEMGATENLAALAAHPAAAGEHLLLRTGAYISLAGRTHPADIADNARRILALYELGRTADPATAAQRLFTGKVCGDPVQTEAQLRGLKDELVRNHKSRNNCYVHVTMNCNLRCTHCYAEAGENNEEMSVGAFESLLMEARALGFRQFVITGGEPLTHTQREQLLQACHKHRGCGMNLVLRTNLIGPLTDGQLCAVAVAVDQVVVSVDGNEQTHDERRGKGTYRLVVENLERYTMLADTVENPGELSLACVMGAKEINGAPGDAVRELGARLGISRLRFRPLLPIGRAAQLDEPVICEGLMQHESPEDILKSVFRPLTTCGIGQNIYLKPDGRAYPCYAWCGPHTYLGNAVEGSLRAILHSPMFAKLYACSVDTIRQCRDCAYRYLCGGACRAWGNREADDINAPPPRCNHLQQMAQSLIREAQRTLSLLP